MAQDPYAIVSRPTRPGGAAPPPADPYAIVTRPRAPGPATMGEQLAAKQAEALKQRQQAALREWHEDKPTYFKKLLSNVPEDVGRQLLGVVGLIGHTAGAAAELGSDIGNFTRDVVGLQPYYLKDRPSQAALKQALESLPDELIAHYAGYLDPEGLALKVQEGPATTVLDVVPAAAGVKAAAKGGTAAVRATGRVLTSPGLAGRVAKGAVTHVPGIGPFLRNAIDIAEALRAETGGAPVAVPRPPRPTPVPGLTTRQPSAPPVRDFGVPAVAEAEAVAPEGWAPQTIPASALVERPAPPPAAAPAAGPQLQAAPEVVPGAPVAPVAAPAGPITQATAAVDTLDAPWAGRTRGQQSASWLQSDLGLAAKRAGAQLTPEQFVEAARLVVEEGLTPRQAVAAVPPPVAGAGAEAGAGSVARTVERPPRDPAARAVYAQLRVAGMTHAEALAELKVARSLSPMTPAQMRAEIAARRGNRSPRRE